MILLFLLVGFIEGGFAALMIRQEMSFADYPDLWALWAGSVLLTVLGFMMVGGRGGGDRKGGRHR